MSFMVVVNSANEGRGVTLHSSADKLTLVGDQRWFLVHTQPRSERRAELHLGAQGFRTHFPTI